jgi:hypothetical protein
VDKVRTNLFQWEGRRVIVELQELNGECPRYIIRPPGFSSNCLSHSEFASLPCGADDSTPQLASASGKEGARSDQRGEDHVKFAAVTLNTTLEVVRRKGESALFREERRGEVFVESSPTLMSICAFEEEKSAWKFVEPGVMG